DRRVRHRVRPPAGAVLRRAAADRPPADVRHPRVPRAVDRADAALARWGSVRGSDARGGGPDLEAVEPAAGLEALPHPAPPRSLDRDVGRQGALIPAARRAQVAELAPGRA